MALLPRGSAFHNVDAEGDDQASTDSLDDLDYMHARYYKPVSARRFFSVGPGRDADPRAPQSWNRYAYVRNNPLSLTDPTGESPLLDWLRKLFTGQWAEDILKQEVIQRTKPQGEKTEQQKLEGRQLLEAADLAESNQGAILGTGAAKVAEGAREGIIGVAGPIVRETSAYVAVGAVVKGAGAIARNVPVEQLIPGSLKRAGSWHSPYAGKTIRELETMARQGDQKARGMLKLAKEAERLLDKVRGKP